MSEIFVREDLLQSLPRRQETKESESEVALSCPTLCDRVDWGPPGSSIHGVSQARILECVTISSSRGSS